MLVTKVIKKKPFHLKDEKGNIYKVSEVVAYGQDDQSKHSDKEAGQKELYRKFRFLAPDLVLVSVIKQTRNRFLRQDSGEVLKRVLS